QSRELVIDPTLAYATYLGAGGTDLANGVAVDGAGDAYVVGATTSQTFPTQNPFILPNPAGGEYAFVTKFSPAGNTLVYSTYLGGLNNPASAGLAIAIDAAGNAFVTGDTGSTNFPTVNPVQSTLQGISSAFVAELNPSGSGLIFSTYLGGSNNGT